MKVLIVEDEIMAQRSLVRLLTQNFPEMDVVKTTSSVNSTVAWLKDPANKADIIFMDVELADGICFEIFRQVEVKAKVIMTTAYDSYALKAFEAGSIDYLLKPVDSDALKRAVARVKTSSGGVDVEALMKMLADGGPAPKKEYKERYIIRFNDRIIPLQTSEIAYVYSEEKTNYLVTFDDHHYIIDSSLDVISEELNPEIFFRVSRSCIVSMKAIKNIVKLNGRLRITSIPESSFEMTVSRSRVDDFLTWLEK
jgi:DNA-binding LytR/AlgR family response regulator